MSGYAAIYYFWSRSHLLNYCIKVSGKFTLLVDNATSHRVPAPELDRLSLKFLPPNTTAILQPNDNGIIAAFKCKYRYLELFM